MTTATETDRDDEPVAPPILPEHDDYHVVTHRPTRIVRIVDSITVAGLPSVRERVVYTNRPAHLDSPNTITITGDTPMYAPSDSDVDRNQDSALTEAQAEIEHYVKADTLAPITAISLESLAITKAQASRTMNHTDSHDLALAFRKVQHLVKELCVSTDHRLGDRVHLDLTGEGGRMAWASTSIPSICFLVLPSTSSLYKARQQVALAVYFDPSLVGKTVYKPKRGGPPIERPDQYDSRGYISIVRTFASIDDAEEAQTELARAVRTYQYEVSLSAYEDDTVRSVDFESDDPFDSL